MFLNLGFVIQRAMYFGAFFLCNEIKILKTCENDYMLIDTGVKANFTLMNKTVLLNVQNSLK